MEAGEAEPTDEDLQKEWPYLSRQQMEDLREAFEMFDKRKAGAFTSEDLHKALKDLGEGTSAKDIDAIIAGLDTDGDGVIDFAQFVLVMMHNVRKANPEKDLEGVFSVFDKSGNGMIQTDDLRNAIKSMGSPELSEDDMAVALGMVEQKEGQIDYNEFLRIIMSPDLPKPSSRRIQTAESDAGDRVLSNASSFNQSFKEMAVSGSQDRPSADGIGGQAISAIHGGSLNQSRGLTDSVRELRGSYSGQEIQPAESAESAHCALTHSKSSKKRAVLASDQQKMASLWSN
ncbi:hypothetical protein WJX74_000724 [Apatococcus lobatus]|uniref:EF-hand domain-containing protein n=1 Tax=Apatococcus lobatus TaxID=904363 RepID=A0AAW1Q9F2_9CHLO